MKVDIATLQSMAGQCRSEAADATGRQAALGCFAISGLSSMRLSGCELAIEVLVVDLLRGPIAECRV